MLLASSYDQGRFFKAADVTAERKLKIKTVTEEELGVGRDREKKLVVWFTNDQRGLPLNITNNRTLRSAFGDACKGWEGKIVVLYPTQAEYLGQMKAAVRVRIPAPKEPVQVDPDLNDELDDLVA
jgi:hypothetical protein